MQISPIQQNKNYNLKVSPSFTAIKSVKYKGLYKEYPEQVKILIDAFKNNKTENYQSTVPNRSKGAILKTTFPKTRRVSTRPISPPRLSFE